MKFKLLPVILLTFGFLIAKVVEGQEASGSTTTEEPTDTTTSASTKESTDTTTSMPTKKSTEDSTTTTTKEPTDTSPPTIPEDSTTTTTKEPTDTSPPTLPEGSTDTSAPAPTEKPTDTSAPSTEGSTPASAEDSTPTSAEDSTSTATKDPTTTSTQKPDPPSWADYPTYVPNGDKPPCIFAKMNIELTVLYETKSNKNETKQISVPQSATASGTCGDTTSDMTLSWPVPTKPQTRYISSAYSVYADTDNKITFHFKKNNSLTTVDQIDLEIRLDETNFPDAKDEILKQSTEKNLNLFATSTEGSKYVCNSPTVRSTNSGIDITLSDVDLIAFNDNEDLTQVSEENCEASEVESANVGAIVGGVIAAVVVVGIVGFIIWRRRKNSYANSDVAK